MAVAVVKRRRRRLGDALIDERIVEPRRGRLAPSCPVMKVGIRRHGSTIFADVSAEAQSIDGKDSYGYVMAKPNHDDQSLDVYHAWSTKPSCGVGTRLYEALAREACGRNLVLRSDQLLSPMARPFWQKQVDKGRATYDDDAGRFVLNKCVGRLEARRRRWGRR